MHLEGKAYRRRKAARIRVPSGEVRVLESHHAIDFQMQIEAWPFHKLCWVAVGSGRLESLSETVSLRQDDYLLLPSGWQHRFIDDRHAPLTLVILCISEQFLTGAVSGDLLSIWQDLIERYGQGTPLRAKTAFHRNLFSEAFRRALKEQGEGMPGWQSAMSASAIHALVSLARKHCEPSDEHVESSLRSVEGAIEMIRGNLHERWTIDRIAEACGMSSRRFTTLFKEITGETFTAYLNRERIAHACKRLHETGHIPYACHESGFNDLAYFYRVFKKLKGVTPGDYIRNVRH